MFDFANKLQDENGKNIESIRILRDEVRALKEDLSLRQYTKVEFWLVLNQTLDGIDGNLQRSIQKKIFASLCDDIKHMQQNEESCIVARIALLISQHIFIRVNNSELCFWDRGGDIIHAKMTNFGPDLQKPGMWHIGLMTRLWYFSHNGGFIYAF